MRWIDNVAVSGKVKWDRASGAVTANITCTGTADCNLKITWNYNAAYAVATVTGKIEGASVSLTLPAP